MIRNEIMKAHKALAIGSPEDMQVARRLLYLLRHGYVTLGLGDIDWQAEHLLEGLGVRINYSRSGYTARAILPKE